MIPLERSDLRNQQISETEAQSQGNAEVISWSRAATVTETNTLE